MVRCKTRLRFERLQPLHYLKDSLIVLSLGDLQWLVTTIAECPRPAHSETPCRGLTEHLGDLRPLGGLGRDMHHPVRVEPAEEKGGTFEDELRALPRDECSTTGDSDGQACEGAQQEAERTGQARHRVGRLRLLVVSKVEWGGYL